ncbi:uncharacterized protein LOC143989249 isoform X3 [Lithobates pipiens]
MRPSMVGALFVLLGIILLQVASADKRGSCPNITPRCAFIKNTCKSDENCPGNKKCCNICGYNCEDPVPDKKGKCKFYETFAPCQSITRKCKGDAFCPGKQKCCNVRCTMKCDDPQYKRGSCPNIQTTCDKPIENTCKNDQDCEEDEKCCDICGYNCQKPVPGMSWHPQSALHSTRTSQDDNPTTAAGSSATNWNKPTVE